MAAVEFFIDNPFISVMTSLSVSQFWNLGLVQAASVTGVVGVSFIVTLFAEEGIRKGTLKIAADYGIFVVVVTSAGMSTIEKIAASDQTVKIAVSVENLICCLKINQFLPAITARAKSSLTKQKA